MKSLGTYTFLPWLRQGLANQIQAPGTGARATISVQLEVEGEAAEGGSLSPVNPALPAQTVEIYGPGDIVGINPQAIFKVEPAPNITNFEANYLPYLEFYEEDFPWRYSPQPNPGAGTHRLDPWLMLIVLAEGDSPATQEFEEGKNIQNRPLPSIILTGQAPLPPPDECWAWAHVHLNAAILDEVQSTPGQVGQIQREVEELLAEDPDLGFSRVVCPRRLVPEQGYHAFLVPTFESGRLAGLGQDPAAAGLSRSWSSGSNDGLELPYYHRWYFRTGSMGDFEYLVRLLEPKPADRRIGLRDMDVQQPGANLAGISDPELGGILRLGGALRVPDINYPPDEFAELEKYRNWTDPYPQPFQTSLAGFINLSDSYQSESAQTANQDPDIEQVQDASDPSTEYDIRHNPDPLITAPLYGQWHALTQRLLKERDGSDASPDDNWVHDLNLDPRWRTAAGFGTKVVQQNQEDYMKHAWAQVGEIIEANRRIRQAQLALAISDLYYTQHLSYLQQDSAGTWLSLSSPVHARVLGQGMTVRHLVRSSQLPQTALSVNLRKQLRPRGKLVKRLPFTASLTPFNLIDRLNLGEVSADPPRPTPPDLKTLEDVSEELRPRDLPDWLERFIGNNPWLKWLLLALIVVLAVLIVLLRDHTTVVAVLSPTLALLIALFRLLSNWRRQQDEAEAMRPDNMTPEAVDDLGQSDDFRIVPVGDRFRPSRGRNDSPEAQRFKLALKDLFGVTQEAIALGTVTPKAPLDLPAVAGAVYQGLDPKRTLPRWVNGGLRIPERLRRPLGEEFVEAMAYPEFDTPMYEPLVKESEEWFLPNIQYVSPNSISLLETNQQFIEAYLVGLNHEFARELLWREYPTDQRGSYFRQFWDVSGFLQNDPNVDQETLREQLKDIPPLHRWSKFSDLGDHDHRETGGDAEEEVVLVIRGELLKKYPTAVIYAHRASWVDEEGTPTSDPTEIDLTKERVLAPIPAGQADNPPRTLLKSPLYEAKVEPDIYFFGFDLTACVAKGGTGRDDLAVDSRCQAEGVQWSDPGWFFVIKERPGEPRFGLDIGNASENDISTVRVWNDLSWYHVGSQLTDGHLSLSGGQSHTLSGGAFPPDEAEKANQRDEDIAIAWSPDMSAAELAYVLYQVPVLVAVHASEMLPNTPNS